MTTEHITTYRHLITLKDGVRVLLRVLTHDDGERLAALFAPISAEDARYLRHNAQDPAVPRRWAEELDYHRVVPLVAVVQDRIVGDATLHFGAGPARHIGELRIFLAKDFRRRGLGTHMLRGLIDLGRKSGLHFLVAHIVADQTRVIKAFETLGFEPKAHFEDHFMFPDGETTDVVLLVMRLIPREEEF